MVYKLRLALILFVIGALSGLSIVAVNSFTEEIIEQNYLRQELRIYFDIFGLEEADKYEVDEEPRDVYCRREVKAYDSDREKIGELRFYCVEDDDIHERAVVFDGEGNRLGQIFRIDHENAHGEIITLVAFDTEQNIVEVRILRHSNTPNYVRRIEENHLEPFKGQNLDDVEFYDGRTGATVTYGSIRRAVNITADNVMADRELADYRVFYPDAQSHEVLDNYPLGCIEKRIALYDDDDNLLGYVYQAGKENDHEEVFLNIAIKDGEFLGVKSAREDLASDDLLTALEKYEEFEGQSIDDVDPDFDDTVYDETINHLIRRAIIRHQETDDERYIRQFFVFGTDMGDEVSIDEEPLISYRPVYENDTLLGHIYEAEIDTGPLSGTYEGGILNLSIAVSREGVVKNIVVNEINESGYVRDALEDNLDIYRDIDGPIDAETQSDALAGGTTLGGVINEIIEAAIAYEEAREDD